MVLSGLSVDGRRIDERNNSLQGVDVTLNKAAAQDGIGISSGTIARQSGEYQWFDPNTEGRCLSAGQGSVSWVGIALTTWADRTFGAWPPIYSRAPTSHALRSERNPTERHAVFFYSFGRANARIGINRSSSGISSMILARARYLASNSRHRLTNRPADKRGK
jgi:hypothetical protein